MFPSTNAYTWYDVMGLPPSNPCNHVIVTVKGTGNSEMLVTAMTGASGATGEMLGLDSQFSRSRCTGEGYWNPRKLCAWLLMMRCACSWLNGRVE
jgi:hypothetical protein